MHQFQGLKPVPANLVELINGLQQQQYESCYALLSQDPALALRFFVNQVEHLSFERDFAWSPAAFGEANSGLNCCLNLALGLQKPAPVNESQTAFYRQCLEAAFLARAIAALQPHKVEQQWAYYCVLLSGFAQADNHNAPDELKHLAPWLAHQQQIPLLIRQAWLYQAELELDIAETPALVQLTNICARYVRQPNSLSLPNWFCREWHLGDEVLAELYRQVQQEVKPLLAEDKFANSYQQILAQELQQHMALSLLQQSYADLSRALDALSRFAAMPKGQLWLLEQERLTLAWPKKQYPHLDGLVVSVAQSQSALAQTLREQKSQSIDFDTAANLSIVERQILAALQLEQQWLQPNAELLFIRSADPQTPWVWVTMAEPQQSQLFLQANYQQAVSDFINRHLGDLALPNWQSQALRELYHEVGNPLTVVRNYLAGLKLESDLAGETLDKIEKMEAELARAGQLLSGLKNLPKPSNSRLCDINGVIRDSLDVYQASHFATQGLQLICELDASLGQQLLEADKLKQILANLLKNAAEHLEAGQSLQLRTQGDIFLGRQGYYLIEVRDTGPGLADEVKQHIFKPQPQVREGENQGLGLAIVQNLAEQLGGFMSYQDNQPTGCCFQLYLPNNN